MKRYLGFLAPLLSLLAPFCGGICPPASTPKLATRSDAASKQFEDIALGKTWVMVRNCSHPEFPGKLVEIPRLAAGGNNQDRTGPSSRHPVVQILPGEHVTLLRDDETLHLRLQAIAIERGILGQRIRIRLVAGQRLLSAVVVGPGTVTFETLNSNRTFASWGNN